MHHSIVFLHVKHCKSHRNTSIGSCLGISFILFYFIFNIGLVFLSLTYEVVISYPMCLYGHSHFLFL